MSITKNRMSVVPSGGKAKKINGNKDGTDSLPPRIQSAFCKHIAAKQSRSKSFLGEKDDPTQTKGEVLKCFSALDTPDEEKAEDDALEFEAQREVEAIKSQPAETKPFPLEVFPDRLRELIEQSAKAFPCPPDFIAAPVFPVVGSFIGPNRPIEIKASWLERTVFDLATVSRPGTRKSSAMDEAIKPAKHHDELLEKEFQEKLQAYKQREKEAIESKKSFDEPRPVAEQHLAVDTTIEALADVHYPRGLLVHRDELSALIASMNQYKGGKGSDKQFWLSAWSCQDYIINRKGREPLRVRKPCISVVGNFPPDMLGELADRKGREDGFIDRFLFTYPDPVKVRMTDATIDAAL